MEFIKTSCKKIRDICWFLIFFYKNTIISYERASNWPFYFVFNSVRTFFKTKRSIDMKLQLRTVAASVAILLAPMVVSSNAFAADDVLMDKSGMTLKTQRVSLTVTTAVLLNGHHLSRIKGLKLSQGMV
jgi:hypothetical protein